MMPLTKLTKLTTQNRFSSLTILPMLIAVGLTANLSLPTRGDDSPADPYDVLYDVLMTRHKDGKTYATEENTPALFTDSEFPFDDKTFKKFESALTTFVTLPDDKIKSYSPVKRALLQRHLWAIFDVTPPHQWTEYGSGKKHVVKRNNQERRNKLQPKIAQLIRRLALTKKEINELPDTYTATVKAKSFSTKHDPKAPFKPFLPTDILGKKSSWYCIGTDEPVPADLHVEKLKWRSAFFSFIRLPEGHEETHDYMKEVQLKKAFPIGTQVALVEQAFLISDEGELVLSPLVISVSLRAYLNVKTSPLRGGTITQCLAEFVLQPRELMKGNHSMKALAQTDHRFEASEGFIVQDTRDPFETGRIPHHTRLNNCMSCHRQAGQRSVITGGGAGAAPYYAAEPNAISNAAILQKHGHYSWKSLQKHWTR